MKKYGTSFLVLFLLLISMAGCTTDTNEETESAPVVEETEKVEEVEDEPTEPEDATALMIEEADYLSKVKLITKGQKASEIKVLENMKDVISPSELPALDLKENRVYLVFLKETADGAVLVDGENSIILLEGDQHELFEKVNKHIYR